MTSAAISEPAPQPLTIDGVVTSVAAVRSQMAILAAMESILLSAAVVLVEAETAGRASADADMAMRSVAAEIAAATRTSDRTVRVRMNDAHALVHDFPATYRALAIGEISAGHAAVILEAGSSISDDDARDRFEVAALRRAESLTPGRLRPIVVALAEQMRPDGIVERHRHARRGRGVQVRDLDDGMAELLATLPAVLAHGIHDRLTQMAKSVVDAESSDPRSADEHAGAGERRTLDQVRADVLADILLGGAPLAHGDGLDAIRGAVQVSVPVLTLARLTDDAAFLAGTGPVDPESARRLAGSASGWDRAMTHPVSGAVLAVDRYRPSDELRRSLRVRDEHCRFPGCRRAALRYDLDHTHDAALGGETSADNLAHLCRFHHTLKHQSSWQVENLGDGRLRWTSPTGRTYIDSPASTLRFVPSPDADDPPPRVDDDPPPW